MIWFEKPRASPHRWNQHRRTTGWGVSPTLRVWRRRRRARARPLDSCGTLPHLFNNRCSRFFAYENGSRESSSLRATRTKGLPACPRAHRDLAARLCPHSRFPARLSVENPHSLRGWSEGRHEGVAARLCLKNSARIWLKSHDGGRPMTRPARARRETVPRSRRLLAAHTLAWDGLMRLSERRVQEKRCACHHAPSRSGPTTSCRPALSGRAATSTMTRRFAWPSASAPSAKSGPCGARTKATTGDICANAVITKHGLRTRKPNGQHVA